MTVNTVSSKSCADAEINPKIFHPGVLDHMKQIAAKGGSVLLLHKGGNGAVTASFVEVGKLIKTISFFHSDDRSRAVGNFDGTFFIDPNGMVGFA